jgi:hypothetical protein
VWQCAGSNNYVPDMERLPLEITRNVCSRILATSTTSFAKDDRTFLIDRRVAQCANLTRVAHSDQHVKLLPRSFQGDWVVGLEGGSPILSADAAESLSA